MSHTLWQLKEKLQATFLTSSQEDVTELRKVVLRQDAEGFYSILVRLGVYTTLEAAALALAGPLGTLGMTCLIEFLDENTGPTDQLGEELKFSESQPSLTNYFGGDERDNLPEEENATYDQ
eukprot:TRINITY_DN3114_c0_g1_i1.p1 TRINITY_DN3114_c0_g1~~TRINITY_DN3114_c0_g1_i1.p1  ORF type:complete len:121 (+),score=30.40 TRINITY_DN3114_c0_g1_i1:191-553(+)